MGWKNIKDHYQIEHFVQVRDNAICIGSGYIHNIIVIDMDAGKIIKRDHNSINTDIERYQTEMDADPELLARLTQAPDTFERSETIWTYDGGEIIEQKCESPCYPNCTHDGQMIYENTHSTDRQQVTVWAIKNAQYLLNLLNDTVQGIKDNLVKKEELRDDAILNIQKLEAFARKNGE